MTTMCLYCGATNVPVVQNAAGQTVTEVHDDEAHGNHPCLGSGK